MQPRYVDTVDERWDENARFIVTARQSVPRLIDEIHAYANSLTRLTRKRLTTHKLARCAGVDTYSTSAVGSGARGSGHPWRRRLMRKANMLAMATAGPPP